jgi:hypothetical protein
MQTEAESLEKDYDMEEQVEVPLWLRNFNNKEWKSIFFFFCLNLFLLRFLLFIISFLFF